MDYYVAKCLLKKKSPEEIACASEADAQCRPNMIISVYNKHETCGVEKDRKEVRQGVQDNVSGQ